MTKENGSEAIPVSEDPRALLIADEMARRLPVTECWIYAEVGGAPSAREARALCALPCRSDSIPGPSRSSVGAAGPTAPGAAERDAPRSSPRTWIAARDLGRVQRTIEALSERGQRFAPLELRELERRDGEVLVELAGEPPWLKGWEVVGRLDHRGGGPGHSFVGPGLDRAAWAGAEPWCEHCGLLRRRTVTYLVRSGRSEVRQIGSTCLGRAFAQSILISNPARAPLA